MSPSEIKEKLREVLSRYQRRDLLPREGLRRAAVLVPLFFQGGALSVLLIKRSPNLPIHPGEIAFPGGRMEAGDPSLLDTALREACEEVGLDPRDVEVVGRLNDVVTRTRFLISPFVGLVPFPYPFEADGCEAERIITLPLEELARHEPEERPYEGEKVLFYQIGPHVIWGATAQILTDLFGLLRASRILCG